jgi:hypothetical protein
MTTPALRILVLALNLALSAAALAVATIVLVMRRPNTLLAIGLAVYFCTMAFDFGVRARRPGPGSSSLGSFRIQYGGFLAASCLIAAGSALYGGAIGILGTVGALFCGAWCLWFLQVLAKTR